MKKQTISNPNPALDAQAAAAFESFIADWADRLDLAEPTTIHAAHSRMEELGLFALGEKARAHYYGRRITTYGVVYLSDRCVEACAFCPASVKNVSYRTRELSNQELVADICAVLMQGHDTVCFLQANWSEPKFLARVGEWLPEVIKTCGPLGLKEVILNVQTLSAAGYRKVMAVRNVTNPSFTIQVRTFQETYDETAYAALIPQSTGGIKHDFQARRNTQKVAAEAGADTVGLGVLFGLSPKPLVELQRLIAHARELQAEGIEVARICLPTAHAIQGLQTSIPYDLPASDPAYPKFAEIVYCLARLAMPQTNWVMSERDEPEVRDSIVRFATNTTVGVHPGVGDNLDLFLAKERKQPHFEQATVYSEEPDRYIERMAQMGYAVEMDTSPERRERIRQTILSLV
jgi:2-iminoacetate synthase